MILDAETLALAPGVEALLEAVEGRELPGELKMELLASMVEAATRVCATPQEALAALRELRAAADGGRAGERPPDRGRRNAPVQPSGGAGHRARPALPRVRRVRRHHGQAAGGLRPARPRRHARPGGVHARARGRPALAAARARAVGELALPRRRGDGPRLARGPRCSRSCPAAAAPPVFGSYARVGGVRRALRPDRPRRRLHALLVGHPPASALRHARGAHARPADRGRADRRLRRARCRRSA